MSSPIDHARVEAMNAIASAMMDAALPLLRRHPPDVAFEAVMAMLFFIGEKAGMTYEEVAAHAHLSAIGHAARADDETDA